MRFALLAALLALAACSPSKGAQQTAFPGGQIPPPASPPPVSAPPPSAPATPATPPATPPSSPVATPGVFTMAIVGSASVTGTLYQTYGAITFSSPGGPLEVVVLDSLGRPADGVYVQFEDPTNAVLDLGTSTTGLGLYANTNPAQLPTDPPSTIAGTGRAGVPWQPVVLGPHIVRCHAVSYETPKGPGFNPAAPIVSCNDVTFTVIGQ